MRKDSVLVRFALAVCTGVFICVLCGCQDGGDRTLLSVDFELNTTLRYKLVSEKQITITIDTPSKPDMKNKTHSMSERLELVMAYEPIDVDLFGLTTIEATCESARVTRDSLSTTGGKQVKDAMEFLAGRSFTFKISPIGKITDYSQMKQTVEEIGQKAFEQDSSRGRVKNPDMIMDFIAFQWYLWDSVANIKNPLDGIHAGTTWQSRQLLPLPIPIPAAKDTTYTVKEILDDGAGQKAIIGSSYSLSDEFIEDWPRPYSGSYHLKGSLFSVLANFRFESLEGEGEQIFNIDRGLIESYNQEYTLKMGASFILPLGDSKPYVDINQKVRIELLD